MHKTTLEQWSLLALVVELGSFARTAEATYRSQSSVSYNLSQLQSHLGVTLLETVGRRAVLTPAGEALLAQVRPLLKAFDALELRAAQLREGGRASIELVVDTVFPRDRLFTLLRDFQSRHPQTQLHLTEVLDNDPDAIEKHQRADVLVLSQREDRSGRGEWLMNVDFMAVAHRNHPLQRLAHPISDGQLAEYAQVRIGAGHQGGHQEAGGARSQWVFTTVDAAIEAVVRQVGFGWLPVPHIAALLEAEVLKPLALDHGARRATPLHVIVGEHLAPVDAEVATLLSLLRGIETGI